MKKILFETYFGAAVLFTFIWYSWLSTAEKTIELTGTKGTPYGIFIAFVLAGVFVGVLTIFYHDYKASKANARHYNNNNEIKNEKG